jgi:hypothetical protein
MAGLAYAPVARGSAFNMDKTFLSHEVPGLSLFPFGKLLANFTSFCFLLQGLL